jgi:hypothetical protein
MPLSLLLFHTDIESPQLLRDARSAERWSTFLDASDVGFCSRGHAQASENMTLETVETRPEPHLAVPPMLFALMLMLMLMSRLLLAFIVE